MEIRPQYSGILVERRVSSQQPEELLILLDQRNERLKFARP